jgi:hypothetical protein
MTNSQDSFRGKRRPGQARGVEVVGPCSDQVLLGQDRGHLGGVE